MRSQQRIESCLAHIGRCSVTVAEWAGWLTCVDTNVVRSFLAQARDLSQPQLVAQPAPSFSLLSPPWPLYRWQSISLAAHALAFVLLTSLAALVPAIYEPQPRPFAFRLVAPPPVPTRFSRGLNSQSGGRDSDLPRAARVPAEVRVDPSAMRVAFRPDTSEQLPLVLARYSGFIGFAPVTDPRYVVSLYSAADNWTRVRENEPLISLEGFFALELIPPNKWSVIGGLERQQSSDIPCRAYALFPLEFHDVLLGEIESTAARRFQTGEVIGANVAFDASRPSGLLVTEVRVSRERTEMSIRRRVRQVVLRKSRPVQNIGGA
jgi:hypothetical protein